jgi:shikimate kinase
MVNKMNIVLIGMSGAGKSTLGVLLAKAIGMDFQDTDIVIQQQEGRLLQDILDTDGIDSFLMVEESVISALKLNNCVIATGGSAVYSDKAMQHLKNGGLVVYLHADFEEIEKRLINIKTRGIVHRRGKTLKEVYFDRLPLYFKYADVTIDCTHKDIELCVGEVLDIVKRIHATT